MYKCLLIGGQAGGLAGWLAGWLAGGLADAAPNPLPLLTWKNADQVQELPNAQTKVHTASEPNCNAGSAPARPQAASGYPRSRGRWRGPRGSLWRRWLQGPGRPIPAAAPECCTTFGLQGRAGPPNQGQWPAMTARLDVCVAHAVHPLVLSSSTPSSAVQVAPTATMMSAPTSSTAHLLTQGRKSPRHPLPAAS